MQGKPDARLRLSANRSRWQASEGLGRPLNF